MDHAAVIASPAAARWRTGWLVSGLGIAQILSWGSTYYLAAVLAKPIADDTGWSLGHVVAGLSLGLLIWGLSAPRVGRLIERFGGRPVLTASAGLFAAGLALVAASPSLVIYLAGWVVIGLGMGAGLYDAAFSSLGRLYGETARGPITMLTLWGGFASTACWPLSAWLVQSIGWRGTCLVYAGVHLLVVLPLYLAAMPREAERRPAKPVTRSPGPATPSRPPTHRLLFGLLAVILVVEGMISSLWSVHVLTILQAGGVSLATAVAFGTLIGPSQVAARVVEMAIGRYHHPIWTLVASVALVAAGVVLLWSGFSILVVGLVCYGTGIGIFSIARGTVPLALFGASGYATLMGRLVMPSLIAQAAAPSIGAVLLETLGANSTLAFLAAIAVANVALVGVLWGAFRSTRAANAEPS
ncbi:MFS transporter [Inquilinus limosus]|uniref:MFS transporter n=1 Tax=Inquilinus limosus TaxID=171674 RepID=A0A211ZGF5_9PROT|nr:MFS transporter [Inquilinus limosus]OWJ64359.1 MFS transporter [Inquilinus limosus]